MLLRGGRSDAERINVGRLIALALTSCLAACTASRSTLLLGSDAGPTLRDVDTLVASHPLPAGQNILSVALGTTKALSNHLVQIRDRESPHVHAKHDLVVTLMRGHGELHVGREVVPMNAGDTAVIVRGERHFFANLGTDPAAAFATFAPPYEGDDSIPAD